MLKHVMIARGGRIATKQYLTSDTSKGILSKDRDRYRRITDYYLIRKPVYRNSNRLFYQVANSESPERGHGESRKQLYL